MPSWGAVAYGIVLSGIAVFATAFATLLLGLGPVRPGRAHRLALAAALCGLAALLVDIYLY